MMGQRDTLLGWWRDEISRHPVLVGWLVIFIVHAGMNAKLGHEIGGGEGLAAIGYALAFLGFAFVGAWAADRVLLGHVTPSLRRGCMLLALLQVLIGQVAGWQSFGLTLSRGAGKLEAAATQRATTTEALASARAELKQIGVTRAIGTIRAAETLECSIKSRAYKDGVGPKCTGLREELATAERRAKLEEQVTALVANLRQGPNVKDGNALYEVPQGIANALVGVVTGAPGKVTPDDVRFVWLIVLVFALEFFGTFGLALIRMTGEHDGVPPGGGRRTHASGDTTNAPRGPNPLQAAVDAMVAALPAPAPMMALAAPGGAFTGSGPGAMPHGAPINITVQAAGFPGFGGAGAPSQAAAIPLVAEDVPTAEARVARLPARRHLAALPADAPPVDRSRIARALSSDEREAADVILAFRAACLEDAPGGIVTADDIHNRYRYWAGERALSSDAFYALLGDLAGIRPVMIGGFPHVRGVALRSGAKLERVA